jgi:hypothetical protein
MIRLKAVSILTLIALVLSLIPAAALPTQAAAAVCYQAQFVADVTIPDGTSFQPNATFRKTWRLRNIGTCAWKNVTMVFDSGTQMGAPASVPVTNGIAPGQTVDVSVDMTAPANAGHYLGYWKFKSEQGAIFGIGVQANKPWWVEIRVAGSSTTNVAYDFAANAGAAAWSSGAGNLSFPGTDGDSKGYALTGQTWVYEDNTTPQSPILVGPQNITNGYVQGVYPAFPVQKGDTFQTSLGCERQATSCYVQFRLAYQKDSGPITTIFQFNERWEGLTKPPSVRPVNLDFLAGQSVKFILYMSAYGSPIGDRALWGNPVIVRKGGAPPPSTVTGTPPTSTPTRTPSSVTVTVPPSTCDRVQFVSDVNVPDGTTFAPGATFTKTWRLKNVGSCQWTTSYQLVFFSGEQMSAPASAAFPRSVDVGQTIDISVNMTAPSAAGSYRGFWMFKNASGALFGIGAQANKPWWVDIKVSGPTVTPGGPSKTPTPTVTTGPSITPSPGIAYDFAANVCAGTWFSGAGQLPCPGTEGDVKGFAFKVTISKLETGATDTRPGILTYPQNVQNGYIQGFFPAFRVQNGDRFRSVINCEGGASNCYAAFRLDYQTGSDPINTFWGPFLERYEGQFYTVDVDLSSLAGRDIKFILTVLSAGTPVGDRALWVGPHIYRATGSTAPSATPTLVPNVPTFTPTTGASTPTATSQSPTVSPTTSAALYQNVKYNFKFTLPTGAAIANQSDSAGRVNFTIAAGTNLTEKYVQINIVENANPCASPAVGSPPSSTENVTINNIQFVKRTGGEGAAGNLYDWVTYSTTRNNACINLAFILHSLNPGNFPTPPPVFDRNAESAVFTQLMNTFNWITP